MTTARHALDVRCPYCNAARGVACRTVNGAARPVHAARKVAHLRRRLTAHHPETDMQPDDIPTPIRSRIGRLVRTSPLTGKPIVLSEDDAAHVIAHHWPWIEAWIRGQVAQDLLAVDPVDWTLAGQHAGRDAARIARDGTKES